MWHDGGIDRWYNDKSLWQCCGWCLWKTRDWLVQRHHRRKWDPWWVCLLDNLRAMICRPWNGRGTAIGPWRSCSMGNGFLGLQLLATTLSTSFLSSSSERIWKGLLLRVTRWCPMGNRRMVFGAMIVFNVVATLGGVATTTLGGVAFSTHGAVGTGVGHRAART